MEARQNPTLWGNPLLTKFIPENLSVSTSNDSIVIDAKTGEPQNTFTVGGKPGSCVADRAGKLYVNLEDKGAIAEIAAAKPVVLRTVPLSPCVEPSGLAMDTKDGVLFSVCDNNLR